ncbi:MAG: DUF2281 domain-containing protein [Desulfobacteraceae bacterium]|nr:DUF2281 domain-containing protein [Desulfobacteraceae bacterium]
MLLESAKQEVLDFVEFLSNKYGSFPKKRTRKAKYHTSEITGLPESCRAEDIFKDVRGKIRYYDDIPKPETEEWKELSDDIV